MIPAPPVSLVQSYWVVPGRLLAGEYPAHLDGPQAVERLEALLDVGIDSFFDLTEPGELLPYTSLLQERAVLQARQVHHRRFPIPDYGLPARKQMRVLLNAIDLALAAGHNVYVHCWGGIGRTGVTVGCYLVRHGQSGDAALEQILAWRQSLPGFAFHPRSPETAEQADFVRSWTEQSPTVDRA